MSVCKPSAPSARTYARTVETGVGNSAKHRKSIRRCCAIVCNTMKRRPGNTTTVSISVDKETERLLKAEAKRRYGGNVSALVAAIAREAKRQSALDWLLQRSGREPLTDAQLDVLLAEIDGATPKKRRRRAA